MAKRFTSTEKYKSPFIRGLQGAYKLFWDYLYHNCSHAGVWIKDFEIAQIYLGADMPVNEEDALKYFNADKVRILIIDNGRKWFIPSFVVIQYGVLNKANRVHNSVLKKILSYPDLKKNKGLINTLQGCKDKDKDMDKDKDKAIRPKLFDEFWKIYPKKASKGDAEKAWGKITKLQETFKLIEKALSWQKKSEQWTTENGQYIPYPASYLNQKKWLDEKPKLESDWD